MKRTGAQAGVVVGNQCSVDSRRAPFTWLIVGCVGLAAACTGSIGDGGNDPIIVRKPSPETPPPSSEEMGELAPIFRRLTRPELAHTIEDLLGTPLQGMGVPEESPADDVFMYDRMGEGQTVSPLHVEAFHDLGAQVTELATTDNSVLERLMPGCDRTELGSTVRPTSTTTQGASLQPPDPSYGACYAGDLWNGNLMCSEVTDPTEVKLRLAGYVLLSATPPAAGRYRIEVEAAAVHSSASSALDIKRDGEILSSIPLMVDSNRSDRTYTRYATEVSFEAGEALLTLAKNGNPEIYIREVVVTGPLDETDGSSAGREACARALVAEFYPRVWRRPLTASESDTALELFREGMDQGLFFDGLRMALEYAFQSPEFLYHMEVGAPTADPALFALNDYEIASRLSYLAWASMPDEELMATAGRGELSSPDALRAQADRLFASPRAAATVRAFYDQWLELTKMETLTKDTARFPEFTSAVRNAMLEETRGYLDRMIWDEGATFAELLTEPHTLLPPDLAEIYGLPLPGAPTWVDLPEERLGLLTHPSLLAIHSKSTGHSPVRRGVFILERILCAKPPPPQAVDFSTLENSLAPTTRERFAEHVAKESECGTCHQNIDGVGFSFENFDTLGRYQTHENGVPVDASGGVPLLDVPLGSIEGAVELAQVLAASDQASWCFARQWTRFGLGRGETDHDQATLQALRSALDEGGIREMLILLTSTEAFLHRVITNDEVER